jgi:transcription antitermination factor NusG
LVHVTDENGFQARTTEQVLRNDKAQESSEPRLPRSPFYAIRVRSNAEQVVSDALCAKGLETFVPVYRARRRCFDRVKDVDLPLFRGYVFSRIDLARRLPVLITPGVVSIIGFGGVFIPISEDEIEAVRAFVNSSLGVMPWPFLREGERVRIACGSLAGIEGLLVQAKSGSRVVVSIGILQRSVSVQIDRSWVTPVGPSSRHSVR